MNILKKLAGQTAIYGIPSIVGRLINFLLIFLFTQYFKPEIFAAHTEFYAYAAFFLVLLPHGMETAFFNFLRRGKNKNDVFTTSLVSVLIVGVLFLVLCVIFRQDVADFMKYPEHPEYVTYFAFILFFDSVAMIPFALLRHEEKAKAFAFVRSIGIAVNIILTVLFIVYFPVWFNDSKNLFYNPTIGIGYVFLANLISSFLVLAMLLPGMFKSFGKFDSELWKDMMIYAWPLIFVGLAGIVNETFDRAAMDKLLSGPHVKYEIGVYGAFYKLSIIITIFIQAFRYAAEPFFFERSKAKDAKIVYATVMNYFIAVCLFIGLLTVLYLDIIAPLAIRQQSYFDHPHGLQIVPILILANVFLGMVYNLSIWYKVEERTNLGALISVGGAISTIVLLVVFVPKYGFIAAAYTTMFVYGGMAIASYLLGQRYYKVPYNVTKIVILFVSAILLYLVDKQYLNIGSADYILADETAFWYSMDSSLGYTLIQIIKGLIVICYSGIIYMVVIRLKKT